MSPPLNTEEGRRDPAARLASAAIGLYLAFTFRTVRWRHVGDPADLERLGREAAIIAFWHECLPCMPMLWRRVRARGIPAGGPLEAHVLISRHRDGQLISRVVARFGLTTVSGSSGREKQGRRSERGGAAGFRRLLALLRSGQHVGITPDGPRGPAHTVQLGVARLAAVAGVPVTPCAVATRPALRLPSWDRMALPLPFGRGAIVVLPHLHVAREGAADAVPAIGAALDEAMRQARAALRTRGPRCTRPVRGPAGRAPDMNAALLAWRVAGTLAEPAAVLLLRRRRARGRELAERLGERRGIASETRPAGRLLWVHAASVGEALSVLPVLHALAALPDRPDAMLLTTGTRTATELLARRLAAEALTPFVRLASMPLDVPRWVARFLDHWRPDAAVFVESELWPNMLGAARRRGVRLALLNARLSARSAARWGRAPRVARALLGLFDTIWARGPEDAARLAALGAPAVAMMGDLKEAAAALPCDPAALEALRDALGGRPCWLAASTHPGEEEIVAGAHRRLRARFPDLLAIVAPRHPDRGRAVGGLLDGAPRRALGQAPGAAPFYVADTVGELGLLFRLARVVFVGRSLGGDGGGQNPFEPARLGCAVVMGPGRANVAGLAGKLEAAGALATVHDAASLAEVVGALLADPDRRAAAGARGCEVASARAGLPAAAARMLAGLVRP